MPGKNAAQRVSTLIERAMNIQHGIPMLEGLTKLFDYQPRDAEREHARRLELIHLQLDSAERQLQSGGFPAELYLAQFQRVRSAFRPALLQQSFDHVRGSLDESVRLCLAWCAYALEDEGDEIGTAEAAKLAEQLRALLESAELSSLPPGIADLLATHLAAILDALTITNFDGATALRKAAKAAATELAAHADEVDAAASKSSPEQVGFMKKCGAVLKQAMDAAATGGKGAEGVDKMIKFVTERGPQVLQLGEAILKQFPN